jgi:hypothetical protein
MTEEVKIKMTVSLDEEINSKFLAIKNKLGIKNATEVFRYIITQMHKEICKEA